MKIALIREWKEPPDSRVALTPEQAASLTLKYPALEILAERSPHRAFSDEQYLNAGIPLTDDPTQCDVLLGIKEVPIDKLIGGKTYFFFSHTIKKQPYNRTLLQSILEKKIRLIDYECLEWPKGGRILGFGKWAGIVGAYNGLLTWGRKFNQFNLKPAYLCEDKNELKQELDNIELPSIKIGLTGTGRVRNGAVELLRYAGIKEVTSEEIISNDFEEAVFANLVNEDVFRRIDGKPWDQKHFFTHHDGYAGNFHRFLPHLDILINGMYWEETLPPLFHKMDTDSDDFRIKVIADITCDVEGSVPITMRATPIDDPTYGWDPIRMEVTEPYLPDSIDVMAVTNLPTEMPDSASEEFGADLLEHVLPLLLSDKDNILKHATIAIDGQLGEDFRYLSDYAEGKE